MTIKVPVLIVGGGPVGLSLAAELGWRGVDCLLVDQSAGVNRHPRANVLHVRTQELLRRWGLTDAVLAGGYPPGYPADFVFTTRITAHEVHRFSFPSYHDATTDGAALRDRFPDVDHSPGYKYYIGQNALEPIIRRFAEGFAGTDIRYRHRLEGFEQEGDRVRATVRDLDGGIAYPVEADYLVACDGGRSTVRTTLGIALTGMGDFGRQVGIYFRAPDFYRQQPHGRCALYWAMAPGSTGVFIPIDGVEHFNFQRHLVGEEQAADIDARAAIERAFGQALDAEIITTQEWSAHALVAERYRIGRIFLAGDAAHLFVPTGGFGMNTGISDAVDLGWRLAATLQGWGGPVVLDAYESERRPIAVRNAAEAADNYLEMLPAMLAPPAIEDGGEIGRILRRKYGALLARQRKHFNAFGISLGLRYEGSPLIVPDGTPPTPDDPQVYVPTARPGHRAPHVRLADGRSTLDLFGPGFTLLRLDPSTDGGAIIGEAGALNIPLDVVDLDDAVARALYAAPLVLIRPDGHVAWRGDDMDAQALWAIVTGQQAAAPARDAVA